MTAKFGPSGNSDIFYEQGYKSSAEAPEWLHNMGLDAYEYSCSRGVNIKEDTARRIGVNASKYNIHLSIHAPYYINLASVEQDKVEKSINYITDSVKAARWMGAKRVVFHPGSCGTITRETAMENALKALKRTLEILKSKKYDDVVICPETMGKRNQLGTLGEVMSLCLVDDSIIPTIDFGHINALGGGCLKGREEYKAILDTIKNSIGEYRLKNMHCHFSRIEFTSAGEKKHHRLCDTEYGPEFEPLAGLLAEYDLSPVIICESRGTMAEDALELKRIYNGFKKSNCKNY